MNKSIGHHAQYLGIYRSSSQGIIVIFAETPAKHYWNTSHDLFDLITSKRGTQFADSGTQFQSSITISRITSIIYEVVASTHK